MIPGEFHALVGNNNIPAATASEDIHRLRDPEQIRRGGDFRAVFRAAFAVGQIVGRIPGVNRDGRIISRQVRASANRKDDYDPDQH